MRILRHRGRPASPGLYSKCKAPARGSYMGSGWSQVYDGVGAVYKALDERLRSSGSGSNSSSSAGGFFFGEKPCSLDAVLYAHLLYQQAAPVSAPELRSQVNPHSGAIQGPQYPFICRNSYLLSYSYPQIQRRTFFLPTPSL